MLSMALMPVSAAVITRLLGSFGNAAVAAAGAAARLEMLAFVVPMALGISLTPFISQNFGAGRHDRIREAMVVGTRFALLYGAVVAVVFFVAAPGLARIFSQDAEVVRTLVAYIRIISFGYGMMEVHRYCGFALTGLHKPAQTTVLNAIRVLLLLIPLSCLGAYLYGVRGVFVGRLVADLAVGSIGMAWVRRTLAGTVETSRARPPCSSTAA
jgi:Na+-driven multidrug efflux pump